MEYFQHSTHDVPLLNPVCIFKRVLCVQVCFVVLLLFFLKSTSAVWCSQPWKFSQYIFKWSCDQLQMQAHYFCRYTYLQASVHFWFNCLVTVCKVNQIVTFIYDASPDMINVSPMCMQTNQVFWRVIYLLPVCSNKDQINKYIFKD